MINPIRNKRVLVVDDEPDLREMVEFEFEMNDCEVECVENAKLALEALSTKDFDLIISDIRMPGGDGIMLLDELNKMKNSPPLLFMSGFADLKVDEAFDKGARGYFSKPFVLKQLVRRASEVVLEIDERWSLEEVEANDSIEVSFSSFKEALAEKKIKFGSGGIMLSNLRPNLKVNNLVKFELQFGDIAEKISFVGKVAWIKSLGADLNFTAGVEVVSANDISIEKLKEWMQEANTNSFIPKAG